MHYEAVLDNQAGMDRLTSMGAFVKVVESGGFSAAGRRLNMSATMVSNHIRALEEHLGARLLNRTTRKVSLTDVGKAYYERCTQILAEMEDADRIAGALQSTPRGRLRLFVGTHIVRFIAPVLADYLALYPDVEVELIMGERMVDMVGEGLDLAILPLPPTDSSLIVRRLANWRPVLCCSPDYLARRAPPVRLADLADHDCLRYAYYPFGDEWHFTGPDGAPAAIRVAGRLLTNSAETLRAAALRGQGLFLGPIFIVGDDLKAGRLVPVLKDYRPVAFAFNAVYPHRHHLSAKVRSFIDLLAERLAGLSLTFGDAGAELSS